MLGERDVMDTPFNVTNYTSETIKNEQARSIGDVLINDPSVRENGNAGSYNDSFFIRGFQVGTTDMYFNGLPGVLPYNFISPDFVDRVEVLKGASGLLYGISPTGAIGGAINIVPKHATNDPVTSVTATYASDREFGTNVDVGRRFGDRHEWGVRFNGTFRDGDESANNTFERLGAAILGLDYRGDRLRVSFDGGVQTRRLDGVNDFIYPLSNTFKMPSPADAGNTFPSWTYRTARDKFGMLRAEYDITPNWTAFAAGGFSHDDAQLLGGDMVLTNSAGGISYYPRAYGTSEYVLSTQTGIRGNFDTGPIKHQVAITADLMRTRAAFQQTLFSPEQGSLYDIEAISPPDLSNYSFNSPLTSIVIHSSIGAADTISFLDDRVQLTGGLREQHIDARNYSITTGAVTSDYNKNVLTPAVALLIKPWQNISLYANYIEGLQQGTTVPSNYANAGQVLAPYVSKQVETGVKVDWGRVTTTLDFFQIKQPSGAADPTTNIYDTNAEQRNQGIEFNAFGEVVKGVRVLGGVTLMNGKLTKTTSASTQGKKATGTPDVQLNLGAEWDTPFVPGLTLTGKAIYTSSQYLDNTNLQQIPSWTRFDLGARYTFHVQGTKSVVLRAQVLNVANRNYWAAYSFTNNLTVGIPRTFLLSATVNF